MKYKAIIIDDEKMARMLLAGMLSEINPEIEICELCEDLPTGVKAIRKHKPDIVFSDIEMPGHSGLELLDFFDEKEVNFSIIFTTAYHQYALQAFKLSAIDYLLKPFSAEELSESLERFSRKSPPTTEQIGHLKQQLNGEQPNKIAISTTQSVRFIPINQIIMLKADGAYTDIYLTDETKLKSSKSLKHFEETLASFKEFYRCHKSFVINLQHLEEYVRADGGHLRMAHNQVASVSNDKVEELMQKMKQ
jgi:two-component system LytT family response regulator